MPFTLTANLKMNPPTNLNKVVSDIQRKLKGISANIDISVSGNTQRQLANANKSLRQVGDAAKKTETYMESLGRSAAASIRRFAGFAIFASTFYTLTRAIGSSIGEAIDFQRELIKIRQVSGRSISDLKDLTDEITRLSTSFGVSSRKILNAGQVLAQAGLSIDEVKTAAETLARIELAPTFEGITDAAEGIIAIRGQFGTTLKDVEKQFSAINTVAAKFAVESSDIITAIRRTGGAFHAAGGELNDLIALFTSVRQASRESAETISTGFRTIFTRIQRTRTIDFLKTLGIDLRDAKNQFIGPYEAIRRLSQALNEIPSTDVRFAQITEELGGFRQIGKVIPLIKQFNIAEQARIVAQRNENSLAEDAAKAQDALAVKITKVKEQFQALIRSVSENSAFKEFADQGLKLSEVLIKLAGSLDKILPILAVVGGSRLGGATLGFSKTFLPGIGLGGVHSKVAGGLGIGSLALGSLALSFGKLDKESKDLVGDLQVFGATLIALNFAMESLKDTTGTGAKLAGLKDKQKLLSPEVQALNTSLGNLQKGKSAIDFNVLTSANQGHAARARIPGLNNLLGVREEQLAKLEPNINDVQARIKIQEGLLKTAISKGDITGAPASRAVISQHQGRLSTLQNTKGVLQTNIGQIQNQLTGSFSAAKTADQAYNDAVAKQKIIGEEIKTTTLLTNSKQAELDATNKQIKTLNFFQHVLTAVTVGGTIAAGALLAIGQSLERGALADLKAGSRGGISKLRASRATSGAGTGAGAGLAGGFAAGAGIGALLGAEGGGPIGAGIGLALGATVGAIKGYNDAIKEATDILEQGDFEREFSKFERFLKNINEGKTSPFNQVGTFRGGISLLQNRFEAAPIEGKESAEGAINNAIVGIQQFLDEITKVSKSFDDLESTIGTDVLETFAGFIHLPYAKLRENIEKQIDSQNKLVKSSTILSEAQETQLKKIQLFNNLSAAIQDSISELDSFSDVLEGTTKVKDISGVFGRESTGSKGLLNRAINQTLSPFGDTGNRLGEEYNQVRDVLDKLPDIIYEAGNKTLSDSSDFIDDFEHALLSQFPDLSRDIVTTLKSNILELRGAESKDTKLFQLAQENPTELLKKIGGGVLTNFDKFLEETNKALTQQLNDLAQIFERRRQLEERLVQNLSGTINLREQKAAFGFESRGETLPFAEAQRFEQQRLLAVRGRSIFNTPEGFGGAALASQNRISSLNIKLQKEITGRDELLRELENEKDALAEATRGLEFFADATARNAASQKELDLVQKRQQAKFGFAKDFTFGDIESRRGLGRGILGAGVLGATSDISRIPSDFRGDVLSFLERFEDTKLPILGGKRGRDVIRDTVEKTLISAGVKPEEAKELALKKTTPAEEKLITAIDAGFTNAITAQAELKKLIEDKQFKVLQDIKENTKGFKDILEKNLLNTEIGGKTSERASLETRLTGLGLKGTAFGEITKLIGNDKNKFNNIRKGLPQIEGFLANESLLGGRRTNIEKLSKLDLSPRDFFKNILGGNLTEEERALTIGIPGPIGEKTFNKIRGNFREQFGGGISQEFFNNDFFKQFSTKNGTINDLREAFVSRLNSLKETLSKDTETHLDEGQRLTQQLGLSSFRELFSFGDKIEPLKKLFEITKDADFDSLSRLGETSKELEGNIKDLGDQIEVLNDKIKLINSGGETGGIRGGGGSGTGFAGGGGLFAGGGTIPGYGGGDIVPAVLEPGEFVIRKEAAAAIGYDHLEWLNSINPNLRARPASSPMDGGRGIFGRNRARFASGGRAARRSAYYAGKAAARAAFAAPRLARNKKHADARGFSPIRKFLGPPGYLPSGTHAERLAQRDKDYATSLAKNAERIAIRDSVPIHPPAFAGTDFTKPIRRGTGVAHFATGGAVAGGVSPSAMESMSRFGENINRLSTSLDNFPRTVEMNVRHTVEVIHNGAAVFASLTPNVIELVEKTTGNAINDMLRKKFPDVGTV